MKWPTVAVVGAPGVVGGVAAFCAQDGGPAQPNYFAAEQTRPVSSIIAGIGYVEPAGDICRLGLKNKGQIEACVQSDSMAVVGEGEKTGGKKRGQVHKISVP